MLLSTMFRIALWTSLLAALAGCAGKAAVLPDEGPSMLEIYRTHVGSAGLDSDVAMVADPATETDFTAYTRTAASEIEALFVRLPNPDLVMYVFPHLATEEGVPVPGYSTVFPLYERVHYALPGEIP